MQQMLLLILSVAAFLQYGTGAFNDSAVSDLSLFSEEHYKCFSFRSEGKRLKDYSLDKLYPENHCNSICEFQFENSRASVRAWADTDNRYPAHRSCKITFISYNQQGITFRLHKDDSGIKPFINDCDVGINIYSSTTLTNLYQTSMVSYTLPPQLWLGGRALVCVILILTLLHSTTSDSFSIKIRKHIFGVKVSESWQISFSRLDLDIIAELAYNGLPWWWMVGRSGYENKLVFLSILVMYDQCVLIEN